MSHAYFIEHLVSVTENPPQKYNKNPENSSLSSDSLRTRPASSMTTLNKLEDTNGGEPNAPKTEQAARLSRTGNQSQTKALSRKSSGSENECSGVKPNTCSPAKS
jgi:hypothetical protein